MTADRLGTIDRLAALIERARSMDNETFAGEILAELEAIAHLANAAGAALTPAAGGVDEGEPAWHYEYRPRHLQGHWLPWRPFGGGDNSLIRRRAGLSAAPAPPPAATVLTPAMEVAAMAAAKARGKGTHNSVYVFREMFAAALSAAPAPPPAATGWIHGYRPSDVGLAKARAVRAAVEAALSPAPCPCNAPTCAEPWEPGCGLGTSEAHAAPAGEGLREGYVQVRESMLRHWLREANNGRNDPINAGVICAHVHSSIAAWLETYAAAPTPESDKVEQIGALLFRDWDSSNRREGGQMEFYRDAIRRLVESPAARLTITPVVDDRAAKYDELVMAVAQKWPGETRHQTALRYIRERENAASEGAEAKQEPPHDR